MEEELSMDNILSEDAIENLFVANEDEEGIDPNKDEKNKEKNTTEVNADTLFAPPESVGSEEISKKEDTPSSANADVTSPNFYSSIATALQDEGVLSLDKEILGNIKTPEDFKEAIEKEISNKLSEKQKRIDEALSSSIEIPQIKQYESTIDFLESIEESAIIDESEEGTTLRKQLIFQDFINKGFTKERAERELNKSLTAGTDIEDAKEALLSNKEYFNNSYKTLIKESKLKEEEALNKVKTNLENVKKSILGTDPIFTDFTLDNTTRQKIFDNISKPIYKDSNGKLYTAVQKYELDHKEDFLKKLGLIFTLTNGFENIEGLVKGKVKAATKSTLRELEHVINSTARNSNGDLKFASGVGDDTESKDFKLDIS